MTVVVPCSAYKDYLNRVHSQHFSAEKGNVLFLRNRGNK